MNICSPWSAMYLRVRIEDKAERFVRGSELQSQLVTSPRVWSCKVDSFVPRTQRMSTYE